MKTKLALALSLMIWTSPVSAVDCYDEFVLQGGYRRDSYHASAELTPTITNTFKIDDLNLMTAGVKLTYFWPEYDYCGPTFFNNFFFSGFANWGWETEHDKFKEDLTLGAFSEGRIRSARTEDYQVGLGYLFQLGDIFYRYGCFEWDRWAISVSGGYTWNHQKIVTSSGETSGIITLDPNPRYNGLKFNQYFQGPFIGTELFHDWSEFRLNIGYEYHFCTDTRASIDAPFFLDPDLEISDVRKAKNGHGNVAYVTGTYMLCTIIDLGLTFKYQDWRSGTGKLSYRLNEPDFVQTDIATKNSWKSYTIMANINYTF